VTRNGEPLTHPIRVRYSECDQQGIVFNANYLVYFDVADTELLRHAVGSYGELVERGIDMVVAETSLRFLRPAQFDDELDLEISLTALGTTSKTSRLRILRDGELLVEGSMRHVFINPETKQKQAMPDDVRRALEPYLVEAAAE